MQVDLVDFERYLRVVRKNSQSSVRIALIGIRQLTGVCSAPTNIHIEGYLLTLTESGLSHNTLNTRITAINLLYDFMLYRGEVPTFSKQSYYKKPIQRIDPLSTEELEALLQTEVVYANFRGKDGTQLNRTYILLLEFIAKTGSRFNEAVSIRVKDCNLLKGEIWLIYTKSSKPRKCFIFDPFLSHLSELAAIKKPDDYLFSNLMGGKINNTRFNEDLHQRAQQAGITRKIHPHLFRHSFATDLIRNKTSIEKVADLLGHSNINTTKETYVHLVDEDLREASERNSLNSKNADPMSKLQIAKEFLESHFANDPRFDVAEIQNSISVLYSSVK